jgi:atypical dual specificity phosphatase
MKISWIEDGQLAASSVPISADDIRSIQQQGIRAILSLTERPISDFKSIDSALFMTLDIAYFHSPIPDQHPPAEDQAQDILRIIDSAREQQRPILVHCHAGMGRTGTVLHLYYRAKGHSFEEAKSRVYKRRPQSTLLSDEQVQFLQKFTGGSDSGL